MSESSSARYAVKALFARFQASRPWLAWKRYSDARGNILAAGIGFFAFFSIFPAVALAFTVFGFVLREHPDLLQSIADQLNSNLPGFVRDDQHPEGLIPVEAPHAGALTITGAIAFVSLVLAGMGWLGAVREGVRAVFGVQGPAGNVVTTKLRDLGVLSTLGLGVAVTAVLTSGVGVAAGWIAKQIGLAGQDWIVQLAGFTVSVLADTALMILLLRVLSDIPVHWRHLAQGALVGGVGFSLLKVSATSLLPRLTDNPLFASIAIVVGLLIWLNLIARLTLISAAWAANDIDKAQAAAQTEAATGAQAGAQSATQSATQSHEPSPGTQGPQSVASGVRSYALPHDADQSIGATIPTLSGQGSTTGRDDSLPTFGKGSGDRTTLAAGAVLGATAAVAAGALARGIRSAINLARR